MIKDYKVQELLPKVKMGNLGLNNCSFWYVRKDPRDYPLARFGRRTKDGETISLGLDDPKDCPVDMEIRERYDNPHEMLNEYALSLEREHSDLTDEQIDHSPNFHGRKRSARWDDERRRRGLIN